MNVKGGLPSWSCVSKPATRCFLFQIFFFFWSIVLWGISGEFRQFSFYLPVCQMWQCFNKKTFSFMFPMDFEKHISHLLLYKTPECCVLCGGPELHSLLKCLASRMKHEGLASWDHRKTFDKQTPECFRSQQTILTFTVRGRPASSQITHHSSQCSLSVYAEVSRSS